MADDDPKAPSVLEIPANMSAPSMAFAQLVATTSKPACTWALVAVGVVFAFGLVTALQGGLDVERVVVMALSLISLVAVWVYNFVGVLMAAGTPRRRWLVVPTLAIMLPYLLGFYMAIYRGLWHLFQTLQDFRWQAFGPALFSLGLGYFLVTRLARLVEIRQDIDGVLRKPG